jgi:hypothetical protein
MKEGVGDLWSYMGHADIVCITTNGFIKTNGECVMGRGCAKQARDRCRGETNIARNLGDKIKRHGNVPVHIFSEEGFEGSHFKTEVWSFPVKPDFIILENHNQAVKHMWNRLRIGDRVPGWAAKADLDIIKQSAVRLCKEADRQEWQKIIIPRPGCGAGELDWNEVQPLLQEILDNRFTAITWK